MSNHQAPWMRPVFFRRNRVFRVYLGGKLFHELMGDPAEDSNEPEEWVCSNVHAFNPGRSTALTGISLREEDGKPFTELLEENPREYLGNRSSLGVLVKYLDSAIRLPMQAHPTREFSRQHFNSPYGKAEAWLILACRPDACIYFGFSKEITKEQFAQAIEASETDPEAMTQFVNRVPVQPGDVFLVDAGVIHAIGAGCLLLEVQEPTDFTIQPEYWCGDYHLNDQEMYMSLDHDLALDCFHYERFGPSVVAEGKKEPRILRQDDHVLVEALIGPEDTPFFSMTRFTVKGGEATLDVPASIWICAEGSGTVKAGEYARDLHKGDYFFLPAAAAGNCIVTSQEGIQLVCAVGGE